MRRTLMNQKARRLIAKYCEEHNICRCENCGGTFGLAPAHRHKRIEYKTAEELADPKEWIALCVKCHTEIEFSRQKTKDLFERLRP